MVFANGDERTPSAPHTNTSGAPCPIVSYAIRVPSMDVTYLVAIPLLQCCRVRDPENGPDCSIGHATMPQRLDLVRDVPGFPSARLDTTSVVSAPKPRGSDAPGRRPGAHPLDL